MHQPNTSSFKYKFCRFYLTVTRFIISLTKFREFHVGTRVIYKEMEFCITQIKTYSDGDVMYKLYNKRFQFPLYVRPFDMRKVPDYENLVHDALAYWYDYEQNWLDIRIESMMQFLSSHKRKPKGKHFRY